MSSDREATALAMRMLSAVPVGSDEQWAAALLAVDALAALLYAASPCGNDRGMTWVRSVAACLCDPQFDVAEMIGQAVAAGQSPMSGPPKSRPRRWLRLRAWSRLRWR